MALVRYLLIVCSSAFGSEVSYEVSNTAADDVLSGWSSLADWSQNKTALSLFKLALKNHQPVIVEPFFTDEFAELVYQNITDPPVFRQDNIHADCITNCGAGRDVYERTYRQRTLQWMDEFGLSTSHDDNGRTSKLCEMMSSFQFDWPHEADHAELEDAHPVCHGSNSCFNSTQVGDFPYMCSQDRRSSTKHIMLDFFPMAQHLFERPLGPAQAAEGLHNNQFFEGDYFGLHDDDVRHRALSVTVLMTKHPGERDGGEFLWCGRRDVFEEQAVWPDARLLRPGFNRAIMFAVNVNSTHAVLPVRSGARDLRRSLQWWYKLAPAKVPIPRFGGVRQRRGWWSIFDNRLFLCLCICAPLLLFLCIRTKRLACMRGCAHVSPKYVLPFIQRIGGGKDL
eukprot:gnl/TRDRNA2_/TRDRNA2_153974_c2_seq1.p1 gnl/TRDRNA2_/TRDRNA2_153974_c2~~gnl/TRDRNA2_/TRDRNA2_153974_c2_seq1.p1  ORF type:complete len:395 (+),score=33.78 gnl/TRDRNA2_/TRDRNA2_153974_c2_seq1:62-1246(+)